MFGKDDDDDGICSARSSPNAPAEPSSVGARAIRSAARIASCGRGKERANGWNECQANGGEGAERNAKKKTHQIFFILRHFFCVPASAGTRLGYSVLLSTLAAARRHCRAEDSAFAKRGRTKGRNLCHPRRRSRSRCDHHHKWARGAGAPFHTSSLLLHCRPYHPPPRTVSNAVLVLIHGHQHISLRCSVSFCSSLTRTMA